MEAEKVKNVIKTQCPPPHQHLNLPLDPITVNGGHVPYRRFSSLLSSSCGQIGLEYQPLVCSFIESLEKYLECLSCARHFSSCICALHTQYRLKGCTDICYSHIALRPGEDASEHVQSPHAGHGGCLRHSALLRSAGGGGMLMCFLFYDWVGG